MDSFRDSGSFVDHEDRLPVDFDEILAAVAPRPVLIAAPELDRYARVDDVRSEVDQSRRAYASLDRPEALPLETPREFSRLPRSL
jgi:hypothetical protein